MIGILEALGLILALVIASLSVSIAIWSVGGLIKRIFIGK